MNRAKRFASEFVSLARIRDHRDFLALLAATATHLPGILARKKLTALDAAMSRNMTVNFRGSRVVLPLAEIDHIMVAE